MEQTIQTFIDHWKAKGASDADIGKALLACIYIALTKTMDKYGESLVRPVLDDPQFQNVEKAPKEHLGEMVAKIKSNTTKDKQAEVDGFIKESFTASIKALMTDQKALI